ncbi:MAG: FkbM family methyltransferase [Sphingomonas sp.]|nr:FkbM family methyltransferase [Sphingomonas sp.]
MYSFSQNFEDVYIFRAFSGIADGFYIDAGAFDPIVDSVTKMLYDLGWSGINLEPGPSFPTFSCRTRDINLPLALTGEEGKVRFYYNAEDPGTSTTSDSNRATDSSAIRDYEIASTTLEAVVRAHAADRHIHFLKLDIEGAEWDVLRSTNWREIRPELILVESSMPYTNIRRDHGWSEHMKSFDYEDVFFDGINTYYLRAESLFRQGAFDYPVNVLDGVRKFEPYQHHLLNDPERRVLINNISEEVARAVEAGNSTVREYFEDNLGHNLEVQKSLVAQLMSEQSEQYTQLRAIAESLPFHAQTQNDARGGNSADAVLREIADSVTNLIEDRERQAADLMRAQQAIEVGSAALRAQEKLADQAVGEARLLAKRLGASRASRLTVLAMTERVAEMRIEGIEAKSTEKAQALQDAYQELDRDLAILEDAPRYDEVMLKARTVPAWRKLFPFGKQALVRRADTYRDQGQWLEAAQSYAQAYAARPERADLCLQMANMLTELHAFSLAEMAYREALLKAPGDGLILLHFGHMLEKSCRPLRARAAFLRSAQINPEHPLIDELLRRVEQSISKDLTE